MKTLIQHRLEVGDIYVACATTLSKFDQAYSELPGYKILFICDGSARFSFSNAKKTFVKKNMLIAFPSNTNYIDANIVCDGKCYLVSFLLLEDIAIEPFTVSNKDVGIFLDYFHKLEKAWNTRESGYMLKCKSLLYSILYEMQKKSSSEYIDNKKRERIRAGIEYIHKHYASENINVNQLAEMCGVSPEYFRSIFKNIYGMPPLKYINVLRMKRAGELLLSGQYTVTETAFRSGHNELSHFCRKFKEYYGVSPTEYSVQKRETP